MTAEQDVNVGMAGALCSEARPLPPVQPPCAAAWPAAASSKPMALATSARQRSGRPWLAGDLLAGDCRPALAQEVPHADLVGVEPELGGDQVEVPLDAPEHLEVAEAAVGGAEGLVGVDDVRVDR